MRLLVFNDVHIDLEAARRVVEKSREADVVVGAGDYSACHDLLGETIGVLRAIDRPALLVAGNNETPDELRAACEGWKNARVLHGDEVEIGGVRFFGLGGAAKTPWDWSFDLTEDEFDRRLAAAPEGGIWILHAPPWGVIDSRGERHFGSPAVRRAVESRRPAWVFCGHVHEHFGNEEWLRETRVVNAGPAGRLITI